MNNWPNKDEIRQLLTLTGISGTDRDLILWYLHECDDRSFGNEYFEEDNAYRRIRLNSLLQSRFFELNAEVSDRAGDGARS